jgi:hypothetical protein
MDRKSKVFQKPNRRKFVIDWILEASDSQSQRRALAEKWLEEGRYADYRYNVETCADGSRIYLLRPTPLNKGFDFQVNLEGFRSRIRKPRRNTLEMPSHGDVKGDLQQKLAEHPDLKKDLFSAVSAIYDCQKPHDVLTNWPSIKKIQAGLAIDSLLRIIKWLFIEQDLTYWGWTGRDKFMAAIEKDVFGLHTDEE